MSYFSRNDDAVQRGGKVAADIACALLLGAFSLVFFGLLGGVIAFVIGATMLIDTDVPGFGVPMSLPPIMMP